jgi:GNAT superfamily N-acetyltransferase
VKEPVSLTIDDAPRIAAFTRVACPYDLLTTASVERSIFLDDDPQCLLAVHDTGLEAFGAGVVRGSQGFVKFIAVHPRVQRSGIGSMLLERIESFLTEKGATSIQVGTCAPIYVVPGVDVRATEAVCFFEAHGYRQLGEAVNLGVPLRDLPEPPLLCKTADAESLERIRPWVTETYPHWIPELERAVTLGTCVVHEDLGFACYDVNREGWFGPIATRPDLHKKSGVGTSTLLTALHRMRTRGHERAEIAWATALPFYVKSVGARVSRVFWHFHKSLT